MSVVAVSSMPVVLQGPAALIAEDIRELLLTGRSLTKTISHFASTYLIYQEHAQPLAKSISLYCRVLKAYRRHFDIIGNVLRAEALDAASQITGQSSMLFARIQELLPRGSMLKVIIMWSRVKGRIDSLVEQLQQLKSTVTLLLHVLQSTVTPLEYLKRCSDNSQNQKITIQNRIPERVQAYHDLVDATINESTTRLSALTLSNDTISRPSPPYSIEDPTLHPGSASSLPQLYARGIQPMKEETSLEQGDQVKVNPDKVRLAEALYQEDMDSIQNSVLYGSKDSHGLCIEDKSKLLDLGSLSVRYGNGERARKVLSRDRNSSDLRPRTETAGTDSGSAKRSPLGRTSMNALQIDDRRWQFQDESHLSRPREFTDVPKRYRTGRGSSVPLDLDGLQADDHDFSRGECDEIINREAYDQAERGIWEMNRRRRRAERA